MIEIVYCSIMLMTSYPPKAVTLKGHVIDTFNSSSYGIPDEFLVDFDYPENKKYLTKDIAHVRVVPQNNCHYRRPE